MSSSSISLKRIVEDNDTTHGRIFDLTIQALIIVSLISFSVETLPDLSPEARNTLQWIETSTVIIFSLEYLLRLLTTGNRLKFIFSFYGIIDLLAILPFYIAIGVDLRSLRIFRIFRVFRILKLTRYSKALQHLKQALTDVKEELILFMILTIIMLYVSAVGIYYFENEAQPENFASIFDCLWWAVATLTTVGYGDVYPITAGGRLFTFLILMVGLGIVAIPTGLLASSLSRKKG